MSRRPGVVISVRNPTPNGGVSPNAYVAEVTAEVRVHWPPLATDEEISAAFTEAVNLAMAHVAYKRSVKTWIELESGVRYTSDEVARLNAADHCWRGLKYDPDQLEKAHLDE